MFIRESGCKARESRGSVTLKCTRTSHSTTLGGDPTGGLSAPAAAAGDRLGALDRSDVGMPCSIEIETEPHNAGAQTPDSRFERNHIRNIQHRRTERPESLPPGPKVSLSPSRVNMSTSSYMASRPIAPSPSLSCNRQSLLRLSPSTMGSCPSGSSDSAQSSHFLCRHMSSMHASAKVQFQ